MGGQGWKRSWGVISLKGSSEPVSVDNTYLEAVKTLLRKKHGDQVEEEQIENQ